MTPLQQRFKEAIEKIDTSYFSPTYETEAAAACEKIAEEFAGKFAEWASINAWLYSQRLKKWYNQGTIMERFTTEQLIQQFKEQYGIQ